MQSVDEGSESVITLGVTGHRDLVPDEMSAIGDHFRHLVDELRAQYPRLGFRVITGLAKGADQLIAKESLRLRDAGYPVEVFSVLPMPLAEYRHDFEGGDLAAFDHLYRELEAKGCLILEMPMTERRTVAYVNFGRYLIDHTDILVSVWDGLLNGNPGGTGHVTQQASDRAVQVAGTDTMHQICVFKIDANRVSNSAHKLRHLKSGYLMSMEGNGVFTLSDQMPEISQRYFTRKSSGQRSARPD